MPQKIECKMDTTDFTAALKESEKILKECFNIYKLHEVFLSFNGGKDCTVLLDITLNVLRQIYGNSDCVNVLKVYCIKTNSPFRELEDFMKEVERHYGIKLIMVQGEMKGSLQKILEDDSNLKACLMGTRRTDPYSEHLKFMQQTDPGWPQLMRVSPLLNWSYHDIWGYIKKHNVPYCSLYDQGYTSIGSTHNTWPNPALSYKDQCGCLNYLPAWRLQDGTLERAGRGKGPEIRSGMDNGQCLQHAM